MAKVWRSYEEPAVKIKDILKEVLVESLVDTDRGQLKLVRNDGFNIRHIINPSEAVQIAAVEQEPFAIEDIKNPSEAVQLAAVKRNAYSIKFIENPSVEVQIAAVKQNGCAIKYIPNPVPLVVMTALKSKRLIQLKPRYESFVKETFKDNTILMKKWLRYGETMRNQK
jgi:hypothetical protein